MFDVQIKLLRHRFSTEQSIIKQTLSENVDRTTIGVLVLSMFIPNLLESMASKVTAEGFVYEYDDAVAT